MVNPSPTCCGHTVELGAEHGPKLPTRADYVFLPELWRLRHSLWWERSIREKPAAAQLPLERACPEGEEAFVLEIGDGESKK